ncbi:type IV secretory system conjugative DNA transfer family protein [Streptomyces leeuwenhoekii]|uniref:Type IV Secretory Pathway n=1 Tax=Streptomyces leeuwenhoekii TaxID=1437453 RepID=A0A0F7VRV6_STRLW|nr:type IV secretory system conjugative DNA transfer family protein [Streptomyces leeuwenhoekii]CQR63244.1 Type IV Secretory Pathway [Streptomyces leeuwenhoekii]
MRRDDHHREQGGIPDGLLLGILAFLLGMTLLAWTATGLAGLFAHGSWPRGVTFARTPLAMRHLVAQPHDLPGAWPDAPASQLSGYGLFWGLFIGQLMVLLVLTVFVMGTLARWRAVRLRRRTEQATPAPGPARGPESAVPAPTALQGQPPAPQAPPAPSPAARQEIPAPAPPEFPTPRTAPERPQPLAATAPGAPPPTPSFGGEQPGRWERVFLGTRESRRATAGQAVLDAAGPALVVTSDPALWQATKDARAKLGPVLLYDPTHLCDTPARLHWAPTTGCEDRPTATARAAALLTPVRPTARLDQAVGDTAEVLLRSYLHAAAVDGRTIRHVHRWAQGTQIQDAVRVLRTNPKAAPGAAGELEAALTAHPERREMAQQLTTRALSALFTVNVRESCTAHRTDALALGSFVHEGGTLYVVGESIEDPRTDPGAMPLLTALVASVVEHGRRMAERSSSGRLDPPLTLVLEDVAAVAPLSHLPELLATGADRGLPTLALLRSREQGRARWPDAELPV